MPPTPNAAPNAAAIRKRAQRAREREADLDGHRARNAATARYYRAQKTAQRVLTAEVAGQQAGADAPTLVPLNARQALADCQTRICDETSDLLRDFHRLTIKNVEEAKAAAPALKARVIEVTERARAKIAKTIAVETLADLLFEHSKATEKDTIERKTALDYAKRLLFLQQMHTGKPATSIAFETFRDVPGVWKTILDGKAASGPTKGEPWSLSSKLVYAGAVAGVLRRLEGFVKEHADYSARYTALHQTYDEIRKENRLTTAEREKFVPWPTLVKRFASEAKGPTKLSARDLALFGIYVAIPPRRVRDYALMRVASEGDELDKDSNWLVLGAGGQPVRMVIHRYKTSKRYGTYTRKEIPAALATALANYVDDADLTDGDPLFPTTKGTPYTSGAFSALVGSLFKLVTGQRASVNILRHSSITDFLSKKRTVAQKEAFAREMAHSVSMQALYDRVDADGVPSSDDEDDDAPPAKKATTGVKKPPTGAKKASVGAKKVPAKVPPAKTPTPAKTTSKGRAVKVPAKYL
jgi:hypothetical protein